MQVVRDDKVVETRVVRVGLFSESAVEIREGGKEGELVVANAGTSVHDGDKVKATIFFRGREMAHPEIGRRILERLVDELADVAITESTPRLEGNQMHTILSRRPQAGGRSKPAAAARG